MTIINFTIIVDLISSSLQRPTRIRASTEQRRGIVSDPAVENEEPPVAVVEEPLDFDVVLRTTSGGQRTEGRSWKDLRVDLHPAGYVAIPATNVVASRSIAVGRVECEEMGWANLVGVVDPDVVSVASVMGVRV